MNVIERPRVPVDFRALRRTAAPDLPATRLPDPPFLVVDPENGSPQVLVTRFPDDALLEAFREALFSYPKDHVDRAAGIRNECASFGWQAANPLLRRNGCRPAIAALTHPRHHATVCACAQPLADQLGEHLPAVHAADHVLAEAQILPEWRIDDTPWTSGVINFNSPLPYHRDSNNLACWSTMIVVRRRVSGGNLHLPELDLVLPTRDGEALFFPGWLTIHGVTPLRLKAGGYRRSAVFYTVARMRHCGPCADELARARRERSAAETDWRARQEASGLLVED